MTRNQWECFCNFKSSFKKKCVEWSAFSDELLPLQENAKSKDSAPYIIETPIVYNRALDEFSPTDEIHLIVIGDNPGKDEQLKKNNKYLVGLAGKLAQGFFQKNSALKIDFRKNAIILNKTPIHSAKTNQLKKIEQNASPKIKLLLQESQKWMAENTAHLHQELIASAQNSPPPELWLVGYSELKQNGIFTLYKDALFNSYNMQNDLWQQKVFVYQHFSMNRFFIDLKNFCKKNGFNFNNNATLLNDALELKKALEILGALHRKEIFGK